MNKQPGRDMFFPIRTQAAIEIAVGEFGSDTDKSIFYTWISGAVSNTTPPAEVRETIIFCLRKRYDHLCEQFRSPLNTPTDRTELSSKIIYLYEITQQLLHETK